MTVRPLLTYSIAKTKWTMLISLIRGESLHGPCPSKYRRRYIKNSSYHIVGGSMGSQFLIVYSFACISDGLVDGKESGMWEFEENSIKKRSIRMVSLFQPSTHTIWTTRTIYIIIICVPFSLGSPGFRWLIHNYIQNIQNMKHVCVCEFFFVCASQTKHN